MASTQYLNEEICNFYLNFSFLLMRTNEANHFKGVNWLLNKRQLFFLFCPYYYCSLMNLCLDASCDKSGRNNRYLLTENRNGKRNKQTSKLYSLTHRIDFVATDDGTIPLERQSKEKNNNKKIIIFALSHIVLRFNNE